MLDRAAAVAEAAAREAGREILAGMGAAVEAEKLNHKDVVTAVDRKCQELVKARLLGTFPNHAFLGEEGVPAGADAAAAAVEATLSRSEWCWIGTCGSLDGVRPPSFTDTLATCS